MCSTIEILPQPYINKIQWILNTREACIKAYRDAEMVYLHAKKAKTWFVFGRLLTDAELVDRYVDRWGEYYTIGWGGTHELRNILIMLLSAEYDRGVRLSKDDINTISLSFTHWSTKNAEFNCCESYEG